MKLLCTQTNYNAYLQRIVNEFEPLEINEYEGEINIKSNFDAALYIVYEGEIPTTESKYLYWLTDENGNKSGVREMSETEKAAVVAAEQKAQRKIIFKGYQFRVIVNFDYLLEKYEKLYKIAIAEGNPREFTYDEDGLQKDIISYWNNIPQVLKAQILADERFTLETYDE